MYNDEPTAKQAASRSRLTQNEADYKSFLENLKPYTLRELMNHWVSANYNLQDAHELVDEAIELLCKRFEEIAYERNIPAICKSLIK